MRNRILIIGLLGLTSSILGQPVKWPVITEESKPNTHFFSPALLTNPQANPDKTGYRMIIQTFDAKEGQYIDRSILPLDEDQRRTAKIQVVMAFSNNGGKVNLTSKVTPEGKLKWMPAEGKWKIVSLHIGKATVKGKIASADYFSATAFDNQAFDTVFTGKQFPKVVLYDLYPAGLADWSPDFLATFRNSKGYNFEDYLNIFVGFGNQDEVARIKSDYREVLAGMLLGNFVKPWANWVHSGKAQTGIQALGAPGNIIDLYAEADIPVYETSSKRQIVADSFMLKFASSAGHIAARNLIASRIPGASLLQCKPMLDDLFVSGINYVSCYDSIRPNLNDSATLDTYIARSQSFLQMGKPDNDFLLYFPVYDIWYNQNGTVLPFALDNASQWFTSSSVYKAVKILLNKGYGFDYISDYYVSKATASSGKVNVGGNRYSAVIVPMCRFIPYETFNTLTELAKNGATVLFVELPVEVPGLVDLQRKNEQFQELTRSLALMPYESKDKIAPYGKGKMAINGSLEKMLQFLNLPAEGFASLNVKYIRRKNDQGYHYFIVNSQQQPVKGWFDLSVEAKSAAIFDPVTGNTGIAQTRKQGSKFQVYLQMNPGGSLILQTYTTQNMKGSKWEY